MQIEQDVKLDFKDVLIRPKRSTLSSRSEVDLTRTFQFRNSKKTWTGVPIIAANMDGVGTFTMANALNEFQCVTALHKHYPVEQLTEFFRTLERKDAAFYSMGITEGDIDKLRQYKDFYGPPEYLCIDVANGYSTKFVDLVHQIWEEMEKGQYTTIMAGNVVSGDITYDLIQAGADIIKVGIGPGSVCTTRTKTGVGLPQLSAIMDCAEAAHHENGLICADGGCTTPGDVAKAFGAGADFVMLGGMLAGHYEAEGDAVPEDKSLPTFYFEDDPSEWEGICEDPEGYSMQFYGMSSKEAQSKHGGVKEYRASEGKVVQIPFKGFVRDTIKDILGGLRSTCTYVGAKKLKELSKRTTFVTVTQQKNNVFGSD